MANPVVILVLAIIFLSLAFVLFGLVIYTNHIHRKKIEEITLYQIHTSSNIDSSIPEILDLIIQEAFTDYKIKELIPLNEGYINEERERIICKDMVALVTKRISSAALDKISLFYNMTNIADVIADKIYILVMNYVSTHNSEVMDYNENA